MKTIGNVIQPFFAHHLMTLYIFTKFQEISPRVSELLSGHILKFTKGYNSIKNVGGVTVLFLSKLPDNALYLSQFCESISKGL